MDGAECMSRYNEHPCEQGNEMENHEAPELCVTPESLSHVGEAVGGGPAVATLPGTPELRRVLQVKRQLSYLTAREAETRAKIEREKREAEEEMERLRVAMAAVQTRMEERVKALESMAIEQVSGWRVLAHVICTYASKKNMHQRATEHDMLARTQVHTHARTHTHTHTHTLLHFATGNQESERRA